MITRSVTEARRELGALIERARNGEQVVIIKDSRPAVALTPVNDDDFELRPLKLTDRQAKKLDELIAKGPRKTFRSPEAAVRYLKKVTGHKD